MNNKPSHFQQAQQVIPGGVNSPVRAFKSVGGEPVFIHSAKGPYLYGENGTKYTDYVGSWGPMIHGHAHPEIIAAVKNAADLGTSYGAPTVLETALAREVCKLMPSIESVRMVSSGTEATMSAIRLARGFTGRDKIIKFEGCYHGHSDALLVKAGSGALTFGVPSSPGIPAEYAKLTLTLPFNDLEACEQIFKQCGEEIACIILEPIAGNMNFIRPVEGFLPGLRKLCDEYGAVLIFDEVMTGFRVALGGAQEIYNIRPDLTTLGKIIGGGLPVGAFGGKREIMQYIAPLGPVYQAGTLSGNPLAMSAGLKTLELIQAEGFYSELERKTKILTSGLMHEAKDKGLAFTADSLGGMFGLYFTHKQHITSFAEVTACDLDAFNRFFHGMLKRGYYFAPSAYEAGFVSMAHTVIDLENTVNAFFEYLRL
ncbi:MAG: glutamate-1-semialdehyde 2,1-aminomutase [Gammaproteobacteria bacterium]|nr:glutamate-1-semialdehyde 2,1-aminomutase [Gammaproteobacteria bacterium]NNM14521.1 glutamate-1-semialdehyde 2,1-aminomutase [Gammaproteobacteria bacterium]